MSWSCCSLSGLGTDMYYSDHFIPVSIKYKESSSPILCLMILLITNLRSLSFNNCSRTHTCANAHRHDSILSIGSLQFGEKSGYLPSSSTSQRVAESDCSSFWIHLLCVDSQLLYAIGSLTGKCLIQLEDIDVLKFEPSLFKNSWNGECWANTHNFGWNTRNSITNNFGNNW